MQGEFPRSESIPLQARPRRVDQIKRDEMLCANFWALAESLRLRDERAVDEAEQQLRDLAQPIISAIERAGSAEGFVRGLTSLLGSYKWMFQNIAPIDLKDTISPKQRLLLQRVLVIVERIIETLERLAKQEILEEEDLISLYREYLTTVEYPDLISPKNDEKRSRVLHLLDEQHLSYFERSLTSEESVSACLEMLADIFECYSRHEDGYNQRETAHIRDLFLDIVGRAVGERMFQKYIYVLRSFFPREVAERLIGEGLKRYHLPPEQILHAWSQVGSGDRGIAGSMESNFAALEKLEAEQAGTAEFLFREFGIANFDRYPIEVLLAQRAEANDTEKPYGIILFPASDWNGSFRNEYSGIKKLYQDLQGRTHLRIIECGSKIDVARKLLKLAKRYHPSDEVGHKMSFAIIGGHGEPDHISFGGDDAGQQLRLEDLAGQGVHRASQFFEKGATIILQSCSTGRGGGIGQELSRLIEGKVVAPNRPVGGLLSAYGVSNKEGYPFRLNVGSQYRNESWQVYVNGVHQPQKNSTTTRFKRSGFKGY